MNVPARKFEDAPATRVGHAVPLIIGITAPQGAGKTFSALRLATGIQRVVGGDIYGIDTEAERMLHYADYFNFRHVPFVAPFGPLDYRAAIEHCLGRGARIIVIDSASHEHTGKGGVLNQIDSFIESKLERNPDKPRENYLMMAQIKPKRERKELNDRIVQIGKAATIILCYRAQEKIKPVRGKEPEKLGWQATTTSDLPYDMTVRFLLPPGSNGVPLLQPTVPGEALLVKNPEQFRDWFKAGDQLSEEMGERLAAWAKGGTGADPFDTLMADYARCADADTFRNLQARARELTAKPSPRKPQLMQASDAAKARIAQAAKLAASLPAANHAGTPDNATWIETLTGQPSSAELKPTWEKCLETYSDHVPQDIYDAYEATRERLVEHEAKQQF